MYAVGGFGCGSRFQTALGSTSGSVSPVCCFRFDDTSLCSTSGGVCVRSCLVLLI